MKIDEKGENKTLALILGIPGLILFLFPLLDRFLDPLFGHKAKTELELSEARIIGTVLVVGALIVWRLPVDREN
jgi:hypothetical protein